MHILRSNLFFKPAIITAVSLLVVALIFFSASSAFAAWQTPSAPTQTLAAAEQAAPVGLTTTVSAPYFKITTADVNAAIAKQLELQAVVKKAEVTQQGNTQQIFYTADHPLQLTIQALQIDPTNKRWQAEAYVLAAGKTEIVKPVSGFYGALIEVPVLSRQVAKSDVIDARDISIRSLPERQLRKDTIVDAKDLLGKSPRSTISAERPIRATELMQPIVIKRGEHVEMTYTTPYMHIKTSGIALEDGAKGSVIRIKNDKSEKAVSGRVIAEGHVEVNGSAAL